MAEPTAAASRMRFMISSSLFLRTDRRYMMSVGSEHGTGAATWRDEVLMDAPSGASEIWAALAWGAVPSVGLLVGAIAGSFSRMRHHAIAMAMSVGAGLLLAAVSLKVAADAIRIAGPVAAALSFLLGAAVFSACNALLAQFGAAHRKRCGDCVRQPAESQQPGSGVAIAVGNALDAVPEAMVLGIALRDPAVPLALVMAFSVGNLPMALSSTAGMRAAGRSYTYILVVWSAIAIGAAAAIAAGYVGFGSFDAAWPPRLQALGAGALLAMAAETMIPEAFHDSPHFSGLLAAFGFGLLLLVDAATR
jgi:ZIP family zinc transporter